MRVAHVFPYDPRHLGLDCEAWADAQLVRWPLAAISRSRHARTSTVHVIGPRSGRRPAPPLEIVQHFALASGPRFRDWGDDWSYSLSRTLGRLTRDDVCVIHLNDYAAARLAERSARLTRVVLVFHGRGLGGWETSDAVVVLRDDAFEDLRNAGADPRRLFVFTPSVDTGLFRPSTAAKSEMTFGFVGRFEESKGVAELPRVLAAVPQASIEAAGSGGGEIPGVTRLGELPSDQIAERMRTWRLLLLPSYSEGFPLVAVEAAASGLQVAAVEGVLPDELAKRPGIHVGTRSEYPELVARLVSEQPQSYYPDWVRSHDEAAHDWDNLLSELRPWRPRSVPEVSLRGRARRFRPPRQIARWVLRR